MLLISIRPRFVRDILSGVKTVELRRRVPKNILGEELLIYSTSPVMAIVATARIGDVLLADASEKLWPQVKDSCSVSLWEFEKYFSGARQAHGLILEDVKELDVEISLQRLRFLQPAFHPPQDSSRVSANFETIIRAEMQGFAWRAA